MSFFSYRNGELHAEDVALKDLAARVGTPFYCYSSAAITAAYTEFAKALSGLDAMICFAMKANSNLAVLRVLAQLGAGADVVSGGELRRALVAGIPAHRIVFSGVGKTSTEIGAALDAEIHQFNVESDAELDQLSAIAAARGVSATIGIRVNPDVDAGTHAKITTGRADNKFGIDIARAPAVYARAAGLPGIAAVAIAVHIGSQLTELAPFRAAFSHVADLVRRLRANGHDIRRLDLGGGLGITYRSETPPSLSAYADAVRETVGDLGCSLIFEPGRALVGRAGVLATRVIYTKATGRRRFVIVDAAMNDLLRPALYDAWHDIRPVRQPAPDAPALPVDIVGPVCESGDTFAVDRPLPPLTAADIVVIENAGAYGAVMSSAYNTRPPACEVLVDGDKFAIVRQRQTVDDLLAQESFADWQPETGR
jgi:diaminopimelate decarboxylase